MTPVKNISYRIQAEAFPVLGGHRTVRRWINCRSFHVKSFFEKDYYGGIISIVLCSFITV